MCVVWYCVCDETTPQVLQHMNQARALKHLPPHNKLTVNVLKDELKSAVESGWRLADGATWTAVRMCAHTHVHTHRERKAQQASAYLPAMQVV